MTAEKTDYITEGQAEILQLEAELAGQFTRRSQIETEVSEVSVVIAAKEKALDEAAAQRKKDHADFKVAEDDCFTFKKELDFAVVELMAAEEGIDTSGMNLGGFIGLKSMVEKAMQG